MIKFNIGLRPLLLGCLAAAYCGAAYAIPALQLGPTGYPPAPTGWTYNTTTDTWVYTGASNTTANLSAFANATTENGGNGQFAWDAAGDPARWAYLVVSAVPKLASGSDPFDITVNGASFLTSGFGNPPVEDDNDLPPHGIYDTYFEIYQFQFDGALVTIPDTQPPSTSTGAGYTEAFQIDINSLLAGIGALHFDLFTVKGDGVYTPIGPDDRNLVLASAPFSHDAEWNPDDIIDPDPPVPAPGSLLLLGLGLTALAGLRWRRQA
jgi:hypothetical protein